MFIAQDSDVAKFLSLQFCLFMAGFCLTTQSITAGEDFARFLSEDTFQPVEDGTKNGVVVDQFGNKYNLRVSDPASAYAKITGSIVIEASGVPSLPVLPALLKLNILTQQRKYITATVQPAVEMQKLDLRTKIDFKKHTEYFPWELAQQLIIGKILGVDPTNSIATINGHAVLVDLDDVFQKYGAEEQSLSELFEQTGLGQYLRELPIDKQGEFVVRINETIERLQEIVRRADLGFLLSAHDHAAAGEKREAIRLASLEFFRRINFARGMAEVALISSKMDRAAILNLRKPSNSGVHINLPRTPLRTNLKDLKPTELLWSFYFTPFESEQAALIGAIKQNLHSTSKEVIADIQQMARLGDGTAWFVCPVVTGRASDVSDRFASMGVVAQTSLNARNKETLIVLSANDREARAIESLAKKIGVKLFHLDSKRGTRLTEDLAKDFLLRINESDVKRIITVELPGENGCEKMIRSAGYELITIDHHGIGDLDRTNSRSSLEQLADVLGYRLDLSEKATGVHDRNFVYGYTDLGLDGKALLEMEIARSSDFRQTVAEVQGIRPIMTRFGPLYMLNHDTAARFPQIFAALALKHWPEAVNVLNISYNKMRFSGAPELAAKFIQLSLPYNGNLKGLYYGGQGRSQFWGVRGIPNRLRKEIQSRVLDAISLCRGALRRTASGGG